MTANHDRWDELAAGYALDALDTDEAALFATHLSNCRRCTASVADYSLVAAQLGSIAHPQDAEDVPSWDAMRARVLTDPASDAYDLAAARRRRYDISRRVLAAAAGVAVIAGAGIVTWRASVGGASTPSALSSCRTTAGCHVIALDAHGETEASVIVDNNDVRVVPSGLDAAPAGHTYVLWQLPGDGKPTPISEFTQTGDIVTPASTTHVPYARTVAFAISVEPSESTLRHPTKVLASGTTT